MDNKIHFYLELKKKSTHSSYYKEVFIYLAYYSCAHHSIVHFDILSVWLCGVLSCLELAVTVPSIHPISNLFI